MDRIRVTIKKDTLVGNRVDPDKVWWLMREAELNADLANLCDLARAWKEWLKEPDEAERVIGLAVDEVSSDAWNIDELLDLVEATDAYAKPVLKALESKICRTGALIDIAEKWHKLFGDNSRDDIERILRKAEKYGTDCNNLILLAGFWHQRFQDERETRRLLGLAEQHARRCTQWSRLSARWAEYCNDKDAFIRCVGCAMKVGEVGEVVEAIRDLSDVAMNAEQGTLTLSKAKVIPFIPCNLDEIDEIALTLSKAEVIPLLEQCEQSSQSSSVRVCLAESWAKSFGDVERAKALANKAEEGACFDDLQRLSVFWHDLIGDDSKAKEMLELAADAAVTCDHDWTLASAWKNWYGNDAKARALLEKAEIRCDFKDIIKLLSAWKEWFNDDESVKRLLRKGERLAHCNYHWISLAEAWMEWYGETEKAKRLLEIAENEQVTDFKDMLRIAGAWQKWFQDETMVKRLLETLEARAKDCSEFASLAEAWAEWLNDHAHARDLMKEAEAVAHTGDHVNLAALYRRVLDDSENGQRLLKAAEESARWFYQLEQLAKAWRDDFGDDAEAERLHAEAERLRKEQEHDD